MFFILSNFLIATINATNKAIATTVTNISSINNMYNKNSNIRITSSQCGIMIRHTLFLSTSDTLYRRDKIKSRVFEQVFLKVLRKLHIYKILFLCYNTTYKNLYISCFNNIRGEKHKQLIKSNKTTRNKY